MEFKEKGLVLLDGEEISYSTGEDMEVEFNFLEVWGKIKDIDLYEHKLVFLHTHFPGTSPSCSERDINCMKGFYKAINQPFYFIICSFTDNLVFDEDNVNVNTYFVGDTERSIITKIPGLRDANVVKFSKKLYYEMKGL